VQIANALTVYDLPSPSASLQLLVEAILSSSLNIPTAAGHHGTVVVVVLGGMGVGREDGEWACALFCPLSPAQGVELISAADGRTSLRPRTVVEKLRSGPCDLLEL
jgi:hypothetical protein